MQHAVLVHYISDTSFFFEGRRDRPLGLSASDRSEDLSLHLPFLSTSLVIARSVSDKAIQVEG